MSLFHIANDGQVVSMISVDTNYAIERNIDDIPLDAQIELCKLFACPSLEQPRWTRTGVLLAHDSPIYLWYLFSKSEDLRQQEEEPAVVSAMEYYAENLFNVSYEGFEAYAQDTRHDLYP